MERFFSKKSVAVFLTTIILFSFFNIHYTNALSWSPVGAIATSFLSVLTNGILTIYSWFLNLIVIPLASFCLAAVGLILDYSIQYTIYGNGFGDMSASIHSIWSLLRDVANVTFIFMLLYAGIQQIISGSIKKDIIVSVITAAVLINFSLFFTKIVIDTGNIVATAVYNQINAGEKSGNASVELVQKLTPGSFQPEIDLSGRIMAGMDITTIWDVTGSGADTLAQSTTDGGANSINGIGGMINSTLKVAKILTLFFVFMFLAIMFIGRYIMLVILMATSPVGFVTGVPFIDGFAKSWRSELTKQVMIAPAIMFFLLLTIRLSQNLPASDNVFLSFFNFIFVIFLLTKSMNIVKGMSGQFGALAEKIGKATAGLAIAGVTGGASFAARGALGGAANSLAASKWGTRLEGLANSDSVLKRTFGRAGTSVLNAGATSSFDVRNIPGFKNIPIQADSKMNLGLNQGGQRADIEAGNKAAKEAAESEEKRAKAYQAKFVDQNISDKLRDDRSKLDKQLAETVNIANPTDRAKEQDRLRGEINKVNLEIKSASKDAGGTLEKIQNGVKKEDFTEAETKIKKAKEEMEDAQSKVTEAQEESVGIDDAIVRAQEDLMLAEKNGVTAESLEKRKVLDALKKKAEDVKKKISKNSNEVNEKTKAHDKANEELAKLNEEQAKAEKLRKEINEDRGFGETKDRLGRAVDAKNRRNDLAREYRAGGLTGFLRRGFVTDKTATQMSEAAEKVNDKPKTKEEKAKEREIEQQAKIYAKAQKEENK